MTAFRYETQSGKYCYQLTKDYVHQLGFDALKFGSNKWATVLMSDALILAVGYQWNGVSFPCFPQTKKTARASAIHDALTQLAKLDLLPRNDADKEFKRVLIEDGVSRFVAEIMYHAVRLYALVKY